jgi:hypothetical protein
MLGLCAFAAWAQTDRSTITGTITDPAGAIVPGMPIEAKNTQTGAVYETIATPTGNYNLPKIPAGSYELSAAAPRRRDARGTSGVASRCLWRRRCASISH